MFETAKLAVDIGSNNIKILYGTGRRIKQYGLVKTPLDSVIDNKVLKVEAVGEVIHEFLKARKIRAKTISFAISGQDIAVSHIEVPGMDEANLDKTVKWEVNKNLPNNGENFYVDYQILNTIKSKGKKVHKILAVAAPVDKVDKYVELADNLNLKLNAIDLAANSIARVFTSAGIIKKNNKTIGVIDIGTKTTEIIIIENGKLFVEREVPFGRENFIREIMRRRQIENAEAMHFLNTEFNFKNVDENDELGNRIRSLFDNVLSSFQKVIQFYTMGRTEKFLDEIYITGGGCQIKGIEGYIGDFLGSPTEIADNPKKIKKKVKLPQGCDFKYYLSAYGILLRRDK